MLRFDPKWGLAQPDLQTVLSELGPRRRRPAPWWRARQRVEVALSDGDHLLGWLHPLPGRAPHEAPLVIHFHGLGSHAEASTQLGLSAKAFAAGLHSLRMNWRGAGGSESLGTRIGAGMAHPDVADVVRWARARGHARIYLTGLSLGAAVILNALARLDPRPPVDGAVCISPPMDFGAAAHSLATPRNRFYDARFVWLLRAAVRRYVSRGKDGERHRPYLRVLPTVRTVLAFDDVVTAPSLGLQDAEAYHRLASPGPHLGAIRTPCWLLVAEDDPFIPIASQRAALDGLPPDGPVSVTYTRHGGHVGFFGRLPVAPHAWEDGHWAENMAIRWVLAREAEAALSPPGA